MATKGLIKECQRMQVVEQLLEEGGANLSEQPEDLTGVAAEEES